MCMLLEVGTEENYFIVEYDECLKFMTYFKCWLIYFAWKSLISSIVTSCIFSSMFKRNRFYGLSLCIWKRLLSFPNWYCYKGQRMSTTWQATMCSSSGALLLQIKNVAFYISLAVNHNYFMWCLLKSDTLLLCSFFSWQSLSRILPHQLDLSVFYGKSLPSMDKYVNSCTLCSSLAILGAYGMFLLWWCFHFASVG